MKSYLSAFTNFFKQHRLECVCYFLFLALAVFGFCVHEPAYDESQAWQIAKTASYHDIFFILPHFEGHPPLWHVLLSIPAKLGISWQISLSVIGLMLMSINGFLLFFKAPFPRWVRCLLPFSFFLFYQYGIIVRPYSLMTLLILLLAIYFPQKDKRPTLFIGLLALLTATHLYGLAIAGGITMAWLWDIKNARPWKEFLRSLIKDKRFYGMLFLLVLAGLLMYATRQMDGMTQNFVRTASYLRQAIYVFLALPAEAVLTNLDGSIHIMLTPLPWGGLLSTAAVGVILWAATFLFVPRKRILYLVLPYLLMGSVMVFYASAHHVGLVLVLFIGYFWINLAQEPLPRSFPPLLNKLAKAVLVLALVMPVGWSAYVLYWDYKLNLFDGQSIVNFLKKYNLTNEVIFTTWKMEETSPEHYDTNPFLQPIAVVYNMYLDHNIITNFNFGEPLGYTYNFCPNQSQTFEIFQHWVNNGLPTVLLDPTPISYLYQSPELHKQYHAAYVMKEYRLWKFNRPHVFSPHGVYLHNTLWEKYKDQILAEHSKEGDPSARVLSVVKNTNNTLTINVAFDNEVSHDNTHN